MVEEAPPKPEEPAVQEAPPEKVSRADRRYGEKG